jgi:hypothetical protein
MEKIIYNEKLYAIILRDSFKKKGVTFFTENHLSQQLAFMNHPKGHIIEPHLHIPNKRIIYSTQEVLCIKKGMLKVNFYDESKSYLGKEILGKGDTILLISGGHGFEVIEEIEMLEIKQGPFNHKNDKIRFNDTQP